jgi:hypothetical protein
MAETRSPTVDMAPMSMTGTADTLPPANIRHSDNDEMTDAIYQLDQLINDMRI